MGSIRITHEMEERIDDYFNNVTPEQLEKDVERSGYSFLKNIKTMIVSVGCIYSLPKGWRCSKCNELTPNGTYCPKCD